MMKSSLLFTFLRAVALFGRIFRHIPIDAVGDGNCGAGASLSPQGPDPPSGPHRQPQDGLWLPSNGGSIGFNVADEFLHAFIYGNKSSPVKSIYSHRARKAFVGLFAHA